MPCKAAAQVELDPYQPERISLLHKAANWQLQEVIPKQNILNLSHTSADLLWVGTSSSVIRYDGYKAEYFSPGKDSDYRIISTQDDKVYVAGSNGLYLYQNNQWQKISPISITLTRWNASNLGKTDSDGVIYFPADKGLLKITGQEVDLIEIENFQFSDLLVSRQGNIWLSDAKKGSVIVLDFEQERPRITKRWHELHEGVEQTRLLQSRRDGKIWLTTSSKNQALYTFDATNNLRGEWKKIDLNDLGGDGSHRSIVELVDGRIVVSSGSGFNVYQDGIWTFEQNRSLTLYDSVISLYYQQEGVLWLIHPNRGLFKIYYDRRRVTGYDNINFQCEAKNGEYYFIDRHGHIVFYRPWNQLWFKYRQRVIDTALSILCSKKGEIWVSGSHKNTAAVSRLENNIWQIYLYPELGRFIGHTSSFETRDGRIFFASNDTQSSSRSLIRLIPNGKSDAGVFLYDKQYIPSSQLRIFTLEENKQGELLIASDKVQQLKDEVEFTIPMPDQFYGQWIEDMLVDKEGNTWLATWDSGIFEYNGKQWQQFTGVHGLPDISVSSLLQYYDNSIYAFSRLGMARYDGHSWHPIELDNHRGTKEASTLKQSSDGSIWINQSNYGWVYRANNKSYNPNNKKFRTSQYPA